MHANFGDCLDSECTLHIFRPVVSSNVWRFAQSSFSCMRLQERIRNTFRCSRQPFEGKIWLQPRILIGLHFVLSSFPFSSLCFRLSPQHIRFSFSTVHFHVFLCCPARILVSEESKPLISHALSKALPVVSGPVFLTSLHRPHCTRVGSNLTPTSLAI